VRDRQSYEFAAASAAVGLELEADGKTIRDIRVALGATKPWRAREVEASLKGKPLEREILKRASLFAMESAVAQGDNHYKIELAPRVIARALMKVGGIA
jgi:xanthine dehydrogenase YagS FAD-binding subunit